MPQLRRRVGDGDIITGVNNTVSDLPAKRLVKRHTAVDSVQLAAAATDQPVGVTCQVIKANGYHGDVQKGGKAILTAGSGGVVVDSPVTSDGTGKGVIATAAQRIAGRAVTAAAQDEDFEIELDATLMPA